MASNPESRAALLLRKQLRGTKGIGDTVSLLRLSHLGWVIMKRGFHKERG